MGTRVKAWLFLFLPKVSAYLQFFEDPNYVNETVIVRLQQKDKAGFCWLEFHTNQSLQWKNKVVVVDPIFCLNLLRFCQEKVYLPKNEECLKIVLLLGDA